MHTPVLLKEVIEILKPKEGIFIDATLGMGGHAEAILKSSKVSIIGMDQDGEALVKARDNLKAFKGRVNFFQDNFSKIRELAEQEKIFGKVSGILLDIGVSSLQFDTAERGFSFQKEGFLDMRMDKRQELTAYTIVNSYSEEQILDILRNYGEERFSRRLAKAIKEQRKKEKIKTTTELAALIKKNVPKKYAFSKIHPATRTFQALRIAVNNELENLETALKNSVYVLKKGGRLAVISFHSLEDRIVKRFFRDMAKKSEVEILTKKPIVSSDKEREENPRSRSAKLRAIERI